MDRVASLPELRNEDRLAIIALVNEYAAVLDEHRWHDVADLCTEDAQLTIRGREITGRAGLLSWADHRAAKEERRQTLHQMTNLRIRSVSPDEATGVAALVLHVAKIGGNATFVDLVGDYHDVYVRAPDGWRFRSRRLVTIGAR